jgi:DnaK suppressor protein
MEADIMDAKTIKTLKAALEAERLRLLEEVADYELDGQETLSDVSGENNYRDHMADQGSATFARELDQTLEGQTRDTLGDVLAALERIENGTYGVCTRCGAQIAAARLEAMPEASLCVTCKASEESI